MRCGRRLRPRGGAGNGFRSSLRLYVDSILGLISFGHAGLCVQARRNVFDIEDQDFFNPQLPLSRGSGGPPGHFLNYTLL